MPRDPKASALSKLAHVQADYATAVKAADRLTTKRRDAILAAVAVGCSKAEVGRVAGVSSARVSAIVKEA